MLKPEYIFSLGKMHARWVQKQASPYRTLVHNFMIDKKVVTKLISASNLHDTIVTGLIQTLCLVSFSSFLPKVPGFASRTPHNLRAILPANTEQYPWLSPKESMCNYVSVMDHEFNSELVTTTRSQVSGTSSGKNLSTNAIDTV